jgi:hypothetical protein
MGRWAGELRQQILNFPKPVINASGHRRHLPQSLVDLDEVKDSGWRASRMGHSFRAHE